MTVSVGNRMEQLVDGEVPNEEKRVQDDNACLPSPRPVTDTVVYTLVRVEGDGTLIPATDAEVIEVEDLLEQDKVEQPLLKESGQSWRSIASNDLSPGVVHEDSKGFPHVESSDSGSRKRNARLEYIEDMLQKVKEEERLQLLHGDSGNSSEYQKIVQSPSQHQQLPVIDAHVSSDSCATKKLSSLILTSMEGIKGPHSLKSEECAKQFSETVASGDFISDVRETELDFLTTEGELCLDNLSIRELQQTFRAAFGRDTSVKDKLWLKRRIAMGLSNSYNVPATGFIIKDKSLIFAGGSMPNATDQTMDVSLPRGKAIDKGERGVRLSVDGGNESDVAAARKESGMTETGSDTVKDSEMEQRAAKRVRKPTKRYIEELSDISPTETGGKLTSAIKKSAHVYSFRNSQSISSHGTGSAEGMSIVTRHDSFGGSGVDVPIVSRLRRGRPRTSYVGFLHQNGMAARIVKKALGVRASRPNNKICSRSWKYRTLSDSANGKSRSEISTSETALIPYLGVRHQPSEAARLDLSEDSDEYPVTVRTPKGGTRRKHHRAWTLPEVTRLVDGVSRCGAGRWSEIKRFAFASSAYRTSVDLKDKWRNLLKASEQAATNGTLKSSRKHAATQIPEQILSRVRELAAINSPPSRQPVK